MWADLLRTVELAAFLRKGYRKSPAHEALIDEMRRRAA